MGRTGLISSHHHCSDQAAVTNTHRLLWRCCIDTPLPSHPVALSPFARSASLGPQSQEEAYVSPSTQPQRPAGTHTHTHTHANKQII